MFNRPLAKLFPYGLAGVIYDCDGTMIDSADANRAFYNHILRWLGLPDITPEQEKFAFMLTASEALNRLTPPDLRPKLQRAYVEALDYDRDVLPRIRLMPGYVKFCEFARDRDLKQAIDTNRTEPGIRKILDFFGLPDYFDPVINSSVAEPKPSPQGVEIICAAWNARPEQTVFVGDSQIDGETARNAGAIFAAFGPDAPPGDINVADYAELTDVIKRIPTRRSARDT